jgi:hypothetical protein
MKLARITDLTVGLRGKANEVIGQAHLSVVSTTIPTASARELVSSAPSRSAPIPRENSKTSAPDGLKVCWIYQREENDAHRIRRFLPRLRLPSLAPAARLHFAWESATGPPEPPRSTGRTWSRSSDCHGCIGRLQRQQSWPSYARSRKRRLAFRIIPGENPWGTLGKRIWREKF